MNCKMEYRTKAAIRILMELARKEALDLLDVLGRVQKKLYIGDSVFPFDCMKKEDAVINMKEMLKDEELDIPGHLRGHLERFLELMITPGITNEDIQTHCRLSQEKFDQMLQDYEKRKARTTYAGGMGGGAPERPGEGGDERA